MATELAVGYVTLLPSAKGFGKAVASELDGVQGVADDAGTKAGGRFSQKFSGQFASIGKALAGALVVTKGAEFLSGSVSAASDLEESASKVQQVFGDLSPEVEAFASTAATALGQSKQQALEAAGTFGNLLTSMGLGQDAAAGMSTEMVTLASDLASFNNLAPEEALEKLRAGLVGEVEPLRALGVNFNAAEVEAKALALGLADANGEISESSKVQARMALIMEKTKNAQGDFARTSDGLANKQRIASAQFKDLQAKIGQGLLPVMTKLMGFVSTTLLPGIEKVGTILAEVGGFVSDNREYFVALGIGITAALVPAFIAWATSAAAAAAATIVAAAPVIALGAAVAALVAGVIYAYQNWDVFRNVVDTVARFLTQKVWPIIQAGIDLLVQKLIPAIGNVIEWYWNFYSAVFEVVGQVLTKFGEIVTFFSGLGATLASTAGDVFGFLWTSFKGAINQIISGWNDLEFKIPGFDPPGPGPKFGGITISTPNIPTLHSGGLFSAPAGQSEGMALLLNGERVLSPAQTRAYDAGIPSSGANMNVTIERLISVKDEPTGRTIAREGRKQMYLAGLA